MKDTKQHRTSERKILKKKTKKHNKKNVNDKIK